MFVVVDLLLEARRRKPCTPPTKFSMAEARNLLVVVRACFQYNKHMRACGPHPCILSKTPRASVSMRTDR